ncbi:HDOD domain-containing protein [Thermodesulfobacteriota bacterium]
MSKRAGAGDLAKRLHNDQSLASEVLNVANSPVYGMSGRVDEETIQGVGEELVEEFNEASMLSM